jgi:hypothetical protein
MSERVQLRLNIIGSLRRPRDLEVLLELRDLPAEVATECLLSAYVNRKASKFLQLGRVRLGNIDLALRLDGELGKVINKPGPRTDATRSAALPCRSRASVTCLCRRGRSTFSICLQMASSGWTAVNF